MAVIEFIPQNNLIVTENPQIPIDSTLIFGVAGKGPANIPIQFKNVADIKNIFGEVIYESDRTTINPKSLVRTAELISALVQNSVNRNKIYFVRVTDQNMSFVDLITPNSVGATTQFYGFPAGSYHWATETPNNVLNDATVSTTNIGNSIALTAEESNRRFLTTRLNEVDTSILSKVQYRKQVNPDNSNVIDKILEISFGRGNNGVIDNFLFSATFNMNEYNSLGDLENQLKILTQNTSGVVNKLMLTLDVNEFTSEVEIESPVSTGSNIYAYDFRPDVADRTGANPRLVNRDIKKVDTIRVHSRFREQADNQYGVQISYQHEGLYDRTLETITINDYFNYDYSFGANFEYTLTGTGTKQTGTLGTAITTTATPPVFYIDFRDFINATDNVAQIRKTILNDAAAGELIFEDITNNSVFAGSTITFHDYNSANDTLTLRVEGLSSITLGLGATFKFNIVGPERTPAELRSVEDVMNTPDTYYVSPENYLNINPSQTSGYIGFRYIITGTYNTIIPNKHANIERYKVEDSATSPQDFAGTRYISVALPNFVNLDDVISVNLKMSEYPNTFLPLLSDKLVYGGVNDDDRFFELNWDLEHPNDIFESNLEYKKNVLKTFDATYKHPCLNMLISGISIGDIETLSNGDRIINWRETLGSRLQNKNRYINNCVLFLNVLNSRNYPNKDKHNTNNGNNFNTAVQQDNYLADLQGYATYDAQFTDAKDFSLFNAVGNFDSDIPGMFFVPCTGEAVIKTTPTDAGQFISADIVLLASVINNYGFVAATDSDGAFASATVPQSLEYVNIPNSIETDQKTDILPGTPKSEQAKTSRINYLTSSLNHENIGRTKVFNNRTLATLNSVYRGFVDVYTVLMMNNILRPLIYNEFTSNQSTFKTFITQNLITREDVSNSLVRLAIRDVSIDFEYQSIDSATDAANIQVQYIRSRDIGRITIDYTVQKVRDVS